jgi:hypothetical protein
METENNTCAFCRNWNKLEDAALSSRPVRHWGKPNGQCRACPPKVTLDQRHTRALTLWPHTNPEDWCAAWIPTKKWADLHDKPFRPDEQVRPEAGGCPACRDTGLIAGEPCPCQAPPNVRALAFERETDAILSEIPDTDTDKGSGDE